MDQGTMEALQAHLIECVLDYLTDEGYIQNVDDDEPTEIIDYSKLSEEEIYWLEEEENKEWVKKHEEGLELYRKRKGELNNAEGK